ncbi:hypothetical protein [Staphylococcus aureus]|uniref:hypothetical protein n=1 Tax=Staphylococcus aureus TaxID=1280 RepID=UPI0021187BA0|nr:hypothetical protein [Staphylococcus aureus]MDN8753264.1 hypothetical protein [Staphylococcus aureus]MDN8770932.1 hypothetical protein [Staphylococcus aureus]MDN8789880.1 hypothetical protein [Staphylococcus aureus]
MHILERKGELEKILTDWGMLPILAIQHMYIDGDLRHSLPPDNLEEVDLTIFPQLVRYTERMDCTRNERSGYVK